MRPHLLDTRVPPPVLMLVLAAAMWAVARAFPGGAIKWAARDVVASTLAVLGLLANGLPKLAFRRAGTTVNPMRPAAATRLVTDGLHRYSRNPMYVGQVLLLSAWAVHLLHPLAALALPLQCVLLTRFQILPEERALTARFPREYAAYSARTRRWV